MSNRSTAGSATSVSTSTDSRAWPIPRSSSRPGDASTTRSGRRRDWAGSRPPSGPPALAMPANKKKDPRYAGIYRDMPGYRWDAPPASPPNDRRCATACWCGLHGDRPTKLWIKTFDPSNGLQTSVSGGFGVVEIGGISGACPRWVTDPAAEPAPPDHKRGVTETAPPSAAAGEIQVPPMRPVTSQVAAEIGYDPAGGTDPGPFTQQVAERLHAADPRWGRRINSTGPISDDTVAYRVGTSPVNPLSIDIVTRRPYHPRPAPVAHLRSLGGDAGGASHLYPGISR